eukprot:scaffold368_cov258-Pinguiococcus_pyrenoidosus.AAC.1
MIAKVANDTQAATETVRAPSHSAKDWREAFARAKKLTVDAYEMCAQIQHYCGNINEAIAMVRQALQLSKNDSFLLSFLGDLYLDQKQVELATICLEQAAKCAKELDAELYLRVASLYLELESYEKAAANICTVLVSEKFGALPEESVSNTIHLMIATHDALLDQPFFEVEDVQTLLNGFEACLVALAEPKNAKFAPAVLTGAVSQLPKAHEFLRSRDAGMANKARELLQCAADLLKEIDPSSSIAPDLDASLEKLAAWSRDVSEGETKTEHA